jgi:23S rRNA U2552 (ribose-2'-O)-methylase RlmE/FtsJ
MLYYYLPTHKNSLEQSSFFIEDGSHVPIISHTLNEYILKYKKQLDDHQHEWDNMKRITNPYEFIHSQVYGGPGAVATLKPLSRSFFKMIELCHDFKLCIDYDKNITTFHLAEGPGGFIEAISYIRHNLADTYYGMTLIDDNPSVPAWKKSDKFLNNNPNVIIEKGPSGTGDLFLVENLLHCNNNYRNKMELITADGGFDFSDNFNEQESSATKLLLAEVIFAITMQKSGGSFVLKIFDIMTKATIDILYLLSCFYDNVIVCKPLTSRIANSEKYIICKGFHIPKNYDSFMNYIFSNYENIISLTNIASIFTFTHNLIFISKIEEINAIFGQQQVENISMTLGLIINRTKHDRIDQLKRNHINKCIEWCDKYNIPHEGVVEHENIFLQKKKFHSSHSGV